ncbi:MAG: hypothetical protein ABIR81_06265 [Ginsengibacter sp.]
MAQRLKRIVQICIPVLLGLFLIIEVFLRKHYGFCNDVLYKEDPDYEYIIVPNQKVFRIGKKIEYNSLSMRSSEIDTNSLTVKILGFGDSVINCGVIIDQDSLATTLLSNSLSKDGKRKLQFLNISAKSWGPDNCYQYLLKHGNFGAKAIFLFVNSPDAHDTMTFQKIVGIDIDHLNKQYNLAIAEFFDRYIVTRVKNYFRKDEQPTGINSITTGPQNYSDDKYFNGGFMSFLKYSRQTNIPLYLYLHADRAECIDRTYSNEGKEIIQFAQVNNINIIKGIDAGLDSSDYVDFIHIKESGQRKIAQAVLDNILQNPTIYKWPFD